MNYNNINYIHMLAEPHNMQDLCSPTRDRTCIPFSGSVETYPLDHRGILSKYVILAEVLSLKTYTRLPFTLLYFMMGNMELKRLDWNNLEN